MPKETPEERTSRREKANRQREDRLIRLPGARLETSGPERGVIIQVEKGDSDWIDVKWRGEFSKIERNPLWRETSISIRENGLEQLRVFIAALVGRYNEAVREINSVPAPKLEIVSEVDLNA